jgi:pimeloyl-ACP methyl ester carboxylesterase
MASVVLKQGQKLDADDLIAFCRQYLAGYKIPKRIEFFTNELPTGRGEPVILLHGYAQNSHMWRPFMVELAKSRW